ncbi:MAG: type II 3-dehydroquinate dehydratase [Gammaproteobacteria bacterium]|nr:type II 3-dehydroquinate dehydratase [Gammaproteobacteria bacterium]
MSENSRVLLVNGPNLNMLGRREPGLYGHLTLEQIVGNLTKKAQDMAITLDHIQSNAEFELINAIHQCDADFIIINPAAFTHTSVALRDAILAVDIPFIEVHLSNVHKREAFRQHSYFSDIAVGVICGLGSAGYEYALHAAVTHLSQPSTE